MNKAVTVFFNLLGVIGLLLLGLFYYLNELAPKESIFHEYRLKLILVFLTAILLHGGYLVSDAARRKKHIWMVLLILAPIPVYWIYYIYYVVLQFKGDSNKAMHATSA